MLTLLRVQSDRLDKNNNHYEDMVLAWRDSKGRVRSVRVRPFFIRESWLLRENAIVVPLGEPIEKYIG